MTKNIGKGTRRSATLPCPRLRRHRSLRRLRRRSILLVDHPPSRHPRHSRPHRRPHRPPRHLPLPRRLC